MSFKGKTVLLQDYIAAHFSKEDQEDIHHRAQELSAEVELRQIREACHMTQKQVAASLGVSQPAVSSLEERYTEAKISTLRNYFEALKTKAYIVAETASGVRVQLPIA